MTEVVVGMAIVTETEETEIEIVATETDRTMGKETTEIVVVVVVASAIIVTGTMAEIDTITEVCNV